MYARARLLAAAVLLATCEMAAAIDLLVVTRPEAARGWSYEGERWGSFSDMIDRAVTASGGQVSTATRITPAARRFDALMLDQRWSNGRLTRGEIERLAAFIHSGKRVLLIGENTNWTHWNEQLLGVVGGKLVGESYGPAQRAFLHPLTRGLPLLPLPESGVAEGGTPLFEPNFATLWRQGRNVLTVLDVNIFEDEHGNRIFRENVATWLAARPVPEPHSVALMLAGLGMGGVTLTSCGLRRKRAVQSALREVEHVSQ